MKVLPLADVRLRGKHFDVIAKVQKTYSEFKGRSGELAVVELSVEELISKLGKTFSRNPMSKLRRTDEILESPVYVMPVVDHADGSSEFSWYGDSHAV